MTEEQICEKLQQVLKPGRYRHTLGVADTAERMATVWHVSPAQARLDGLLHDCGKEAGDALSHGPIGARLACTDYGVTDEEILSAIACHLTLLKILKDTLDYLKASGKEIDTRSLDTYHYYLHKHNSEN